MIFCAGGLFQIWLGHINVITIQTDARASDDGKWAAFSFLFLHSFFFKLFCVCSSLWMSLYISSISIWLLFCWHSALFSSLSFESILFYVQLLNKLVFLNEHMKSSFPKRYKSILIVFMKITFFLPRPIHFVNIQFIMLKWSVGSVWTC